MGRKIDTTPHTSLLVKIGSASFTVSQSLSELVANSMDARRPDSPARVEVTLAPNEIIVADDGVGMTEAVLAKAVRMAWPMRDFKSSGVVRKSEFGLGMKTACASLGHRWKLQTIVEGADAGLEVEFDLRKLASSDGTWEVEVQDIPRKKLKLPPGARSGTVLTVTEFQVVANDEVVREELSRSYAPHLRAQDEIILNGVPLKVEPPELQSGTRIEIDVTVSGVRIHGWGGLLDGRGSLTKYGFHWYRKNQLIVSYDRSFIPNHPTYRKVTGELYADGMPVNFNKHGFETSSSQWKEAIEELGALPQVTKLLEQARKRAKVEKPDEWTAGQQKGAVDSLNGTATDVVVRVIDADDIPSSYIVPTSAADAGGKSEFGDERAPLVIEGKNYRWRHTFASLGHEGPICDYTLEGEGEILVVTNADSPVSGFIEERGVLTMLHTADAVMRWLVEEKKCDFTKAVAFRDRWLATACERLKAGVQ